jgi:hypothetical protein
MEEWQWKNRIPCPGGQSIVISFLFFSSFSSERRTSSSSSSSLSVPSLVQSTSFTQSLLILIIGYVLPRIPA